MNFFSRVCGALRSVVLFILLLAANIAVHAQEKPVKGKVTYLSAGTVYTSIGWESGVQDSALLFVATGIDTVAELKIIAVSSKSCACVVVNQKRDVVIGDGVVGTFVENKSNAIAMTESRDTTSQVKSIRGPQPLNVGLKSGEKSFLNVQGRFSLQYYSTRFDNNSYNFTEPGAVLNLHATSPEIPLRLDIYGNLRTLARGSTSPFSNSAEDASRIYQFSLAYSDNKDDLAVGRIIPMYAPSIGSIDGITYSHRCGNFLGGTSIGFQPSYTLQGVSTDTRKVALFAQYQTHGAVELAVTSAYARTYMQSLLDREAVSFMVNGYTSGGFSVYGYSDIDLRMKQGKDFNLAPSISMGSANINYRFTYFLTVGVGVDASRAVFPFSTVQFVADSLLDRTLRSGATVTINVSLMNGLNLFNTYSPRSANAGFGSDYLNNSALFLTNVLSTGTTVRATYTMNDNEFTSSRVYGMNVERSFYGVSLTLRYQQNQYRVLQLNQDNKGETMGGDIMALITAHLSFVTSFDSMRGFGSNSYSIFSELSWRF